jgi:hypothetical protein
VPIKKTFDLEDDQLVKVYTKLLKTFKEGTKEYRHYKNKINNRKIELEKYPDRHLSALLDDDLDELLEKLDIKVDTIK